MIVDLGPFSGTSWLLFLGRHEDLPDGDTITV
jgi:hypothetical protein